MISVKSVLRQIPDPCGKQGLQHPLEALLGLIFLSMLSGCKGMRSVFCLGRSLSRKQLNMLGFRRYLASPCHATFTGLLRVLAPEALDKLSTNSLLQSVIVRGMKGCSDIFQLMARHFAVVKMQMARLNMSCLLSVQFLVNLLATAYHEAKDLEYPMLCVF